MNEFERLIHIWKNQFRRWRESTGKPEFKTPAIKMCPNCGRFNADNVGECEYCQTILDPKRRVTVDESGREQAQFNPVVALFGICVFGYFVTVLLAGKLPDQTVFSAIWSPGRMLDLMGANSSARVFGEGEWWRTLTFSFLHVSAIHIFMNFSALGSLGPTLWQELGTRRFWLTTLFTGWTGGLLSVSSFLATGHPTASAGISASLFGFLGVLYMHYRSKGLLSYAAVYKKYIIMGNVICIVLTIIGYPIDNLGHIGGALGGLALGASFYARPFRKFGDWPERILLGGLTLFGLYGAFQVVLNIQSFLGA